MPVIVDSLKKTLEGLIDVDKNLSHMARGPARDQVKAANLELLERLEATPADVLAPPRRHRARQPDQEIPAPCARCSELERDLAAALEELAAANDRATRLAGALRESSSRAMVTHAEAFPNA